MRTKCFFCRLSLFEDNDEIQSNSEHGSGFSPVSYWQNMIQYVIKRFLLNFCIDQPFIWQPSVHPTPTSVLTGLFDWSHSKAEAGSVWFKHHFNAPVLAVVPVSGSVWIVFVLLKHSSSVPIMFIIAGFKYDKTNNIQQRNSFQLHYEFSFIVFLYCFLRIIFVKFLTLNV